MRVAAFVLGGLCMAACGGDGGGAAPDAAIDAGEPDAMEPAGLCTSCGACVESQALEAAAAHLAGGIDYADLPPLGGAHDPCWTRFGIYESEVPDERWVHNLEHGAVVFLYNCPDGCPDEIAALEFLASPRPFALVMPYAALPGRFAAVAWGQRLVSDCYDEEAFQAFYEAHFNHAPESSTSPPPSGC